MRAKSARSTSNGRARLPADRGALNAVTIPLRNHPADIVNEWAFNDTQRFPGANGCKFGQFGLSPAGITPMLNLFQHQISSKPCLDEY